MIDQHKKNYTNADIIKRLESMDGRIGAIEIWKLSQEAGRAAVDEYKRQEINDRNNRDRQGLYSGLKDIIPYVVLVLGGLAALIYAYASRPH